MIGAMDRSDSETRADPFPARRRHICVARCAEPSITGSGRRKLARLRVRLAARISTLCETRQTILADLSQRGARVLTEARFEPGCEVLLEWGEHEALGEVVWCNLNQCGIAFVEPIDEATLIATRQLNDAARLPREREVLRRIARRWASGTDQS